MTSRLGYIFGGSVAFLLALIAVLNFLTLRELRSVTTYSDVTAAPDRETRQQLLQDIPLVRVYGTVDVTGSVDIDNAVEVHGFVDVSSIGETVLVEVVNDPLGVIAY